MQDNKAAWLPGIFFLKYFAASAIFPNLIAACLWGLAGKHVLAARDG
jgi:hypothetical protein